MVDKTSNVPDSQCRRITMVVAGVLALLTLAGLAMIMTAWKTGLVE
jgi:hypothetical protein